MSKQTGWKMVAKKECSLRILKDVMSHKKLKRVVFDFTTIVRHKLVSTGKNYW
jgi:hypothetical protein